MGDLTYDAFSDAGWSDASQRDTFTFDYHYRKTENIGGRSRLIGFFNFARSGNDPLITNTSMYGSKMLIKNWTNSGLDGIQFSNTYFSSKQIDAMSK